MIIIILTNYELNIKSNITFKRNDHFNFLLFLVLLELVLGGSGRMLVYGSFITLRYLIFIMSMLYFAYRTITFGYIIKKDIFYLDILLFLLVIIFSSINGLLRNHDFSDVIKNLQGYLYILMYFPLSLIINTPKKAIKAKKIFINASVVLSIVSLIIFMVFYLDNSFYYVISPILDKYTYGYISLRYGLPAVFLKTCPYIAISFILLFYEIIYLKISRKILVYVKLLILMFGSTITMSVGIWISVFIGLFFIFIIAKGKYRLISIIAILAIAVVLIALLYDYIIVVLNSRFSVTDSSYIIKKDQLFVLFKHWLDNVFIGKGFGYKIVFNTIYGERFMLNYELFWLQVLLNMGICGILIYFKIFYKLYFKTKKLFFKLYLYEKVHLSSLLVGLLMLCVVSSVNPFLNNPIGIGYMLLVMVSVSAYYKNI